MDDIFSLDDFLFWDVNDDSAFTEHEIYLASLADPGDGSSRPMEANRPVGADKKKMMLSRNDERRTYVKLFEDAYNSTDPQKLLQFIQGYCSPDCVMIQRCVVNDNPFIPRYIEVRGNMAIHQFWCNIFMSIPDCLMVILETKLRIRRPTEENRNDASFLVSSFSFTGTKLYSLAMEGAILEPPEGFDLCVTNGGGASSGGGGGGSTAAKGKKLDDSQSVHALVAKAQQRSSRKRPLEGISSSSSNSLSASGPASTGGGYGMGSNGDYPPSSSSSLTMTNLGTSMSNALGSALTTTTTMGSTASSSASTSLAASTAAEGVDKFNIFLHPPRKYSTLAGTRYGGNACHYIQSKNVLKPNTVAKVSDYVAINECTKLRMGEYIQTEGLINFLGTLTMTLNAEKKITKFEFLYSHMD